MEVSKEEMLVAFKSRLLSRPIIDMEAGIYLDTRLIKKICEEKDLHRNKFEKSAVELLNEILEETFANSLFMTSQGKMMMGNIKGVQFEGTIPKVCTYSNQYPIMKREDENSPVIAENLSELELHITQDIKNAITRNRNRLSAITDLPIIVNEICYGIKKDTSYSNYSKVQDGLLKVEESNGLLKKMAFDLLDDLKLILSEIDIFWD